MEGLFPATYTITEQPIDRYEPQQTQTVTPVSYTHLDVYKRQPHYYYIKNGEVADAQKGYTQFQPDRLWEWVAKNYLEGMK